jgi:hypothetical protein
LQIFSDEHRDSVKKEHPQAPFFEQNKILVGMWKVVSAEEKEKYKALSKVCGSLLCFSLSLSRTSGRMVLR